MKTLYKSIVGLLIGFTVANSYATSDSTIVELDVTHAPYVNLLGSVVGATKYFSITDIKPSNGGSPKLTIGQLGLESNIAGSCTVTFSSQNNFKLRHTITNQRLTRYIFRYKGKKFNQNNLSRVYPSCNLPLSTLKIKRKGPFNNNATAGIYQDIVTITVTTQ